MALPLRRSLSGVTCPLAYNDNLQHPLTFYYGSCAWHTIQTICSVEEEGLVPGLDVRRLGIWSAHVNHSQGGPSPLGFSFLICEMQIIILVLRLILKSWNP